MFSLIRDEATGRFTATLPGLPAVADARTAGAARRMAAKAIALLGPAAMPGPTALPVEVDGAAFVRGLAALGWRVEAVHGSARRFAHESRRERLVVAFHEGLGRRTVALALQAAGIGEAEFLAALPRTGTA